jgi:predicted Holliday junction resolvase-like endonuclease
MVDGWLIGLGVGLLTGGLVAWIWKLRFARRLRRDAVLRSQAVVVGKAVEQVAAWLPGFDYDPRDARFLGSPVDLVVFDGLARGRVEAVVFLEVKTGGAVLSEREREVRAAIREGRVVWREWRPLR